LQVVTVEVAAVGVAVAAGVAVEAVQRGALGKMRSKQAGTESRSERTMTGALHRATVTAALRLTMPAAAATTGDGMLYMGWGDSPY
jgi:hypothetical protein